MPGQCHGPQVDVTRLPFPDGAFDVVICSEVMEHIPDNRKAVSELMRVLKPGGDLVVSVPPLAPGADLLGSLGGLYQRAGRPHPDLSEAGDSEASGGGGRHVPGDRLPARSSRSLLVAQVPRRPQAGRLAAGQSLQAFSRVGHHGETPAHGNPGPDAEPADRQERRILPEEGLLTWSAH